MSEMIRSSTSVTARWRTLVPLTAAMAVAHLLLLAASVSHAETASPIRPVSSVSARVVVAAMTPVVAEPPAARPPAPVRPARPVTPAKPKDAPKEAPDDGAKHPVASAAPAMARTVALATPEAASASGNAPPAYTTKMPAPITMRYDMHRGAWSGTGELAWQPAGDRYKAHLEGRVAGFKVMTWHSEGSFDGAGIAPVRFTDQRRGKSMLAANFQRAAAKITYSGTTEEHLLLPGAQDRLSWMVQIAAIAAADPQRIASGRKVSMLVSGARGDADVWSFQGVGTESVSTGAGPVMAVKLLREPRKPRDTRVEVWLDPKQAYLPVRARLSSADGDALELLQRAVDPS